MNRLALATLLAGAAGCAPSRIVDAVDLELTNLPHVCGASSVDQRLSIFMQNQTGLSPDKELEEITIDPDNALSTKVGFYTYGNPEGVTVSDQDLEQVQEYAVAIMCAREQGVFPTITSIPTECSNFRLTPCGFDHLDYPDYDNTDEVFTDPPCDGSVSNFIEAGETAPKDEDRVFLSCDI